MTGVTALARAAHLGPSLVVTVVTVGLGVSAGLGAGPLVLLGSSILLGQLSIGWSNDWIDGRLGRDAARTDKPTASGDVAASTLRTAAVVAVVACAVVSLGLGPRAAVVHLIAVAGGWAYNAWLKATSVSVLPYVLSFGLLPVIVAATSQPGAALLTGSSGSGLVEAGLAGAPWWAIVTAACFGAGAHLANALPDLEDDARTGVRGLPQRLGPRWSVVGTVLLLGAGAVAVLVVPVGTFDAVAVVGGAIVTLLLVVLVAMAGRGRPDVAFKVAMLTGLVVVGLLVLRGGALA